MSGKKTAIITGASGAIGAALVAGFLQEGYNVIATSRHTNQKLTASGSLVRIDGDIGKQQTAADAVEAAIKNFGTIDVLVNNAGIFLNKPFTDFTIEDFDALVSTNLLGFFYMQIYLSRAVKRLAHRLFPGQVPTKLVPPEPYEHDTFTLERRELRIIEQGRTDGPDSTSLYVPSIGLIVAGDVVYNQCRM